MKLKEIRRAIESAVNLMYSAILSPANSSQKRKDGPILSGPCRARERRTCTDEGIGKYVDSLNVPFD